MIIRQEYIRYIMNRVPFDIHLVLSRTDTKHIRLIRTLKGSCIETMYATAKTDEEIADFAAAAFSELRVRIERDGMVGFNKAMYDFDTMLDEFFEETVFDTRKMIRISIPKWMEKLFAILNKDKSKV